MRHFAAFTDKKLELLEIWLDLINRGHRTTLDVKAANKLRISPVTVRTRKSRMRAKYEASLNFCREYRSWQQKFF